MQASEEWVHGLMDRMDGMPHSHPCEQAGDVAALLAQYGYVAVVDRQTSTATFRTSVYEFRIDCRNLVMRVTKTKLNERGM